MDSDAGDTSVFRAATDEEGWERDGSNSMDEAEQRQDSMNIQDYVAELSLGSEDALGLEQLRAQSDDEEPHVSFVSEREVNEARTDAVEYMADRLFALLQGGDHGCSEEQHTEDLRQHMEQEGENHYG